MHVAYLSLSLRSMFNLTLDFLFYIFTLIVRKDLRRKTILMFFPSYIISSSCGFLPQAHLGINAILKNIFKQKQSVALAQAYNKIYLFDTELD